MHKDNFVADIIATWTAFSTTIILKNKRKLTIIKGVAPAWAITKFLNGKRVSEQWDGNTNFIITINSNR